jgi:hypothetical protein
MPSKILKISGLIVLTLAILLLLYFSISSLNSNITQNQIVQIKEDSQNLNVKITLLDVEKDLEVYNDGDFVGNINSSTGSSYRLYHISRGDTIEVYTQEEKSLVSSLTIFENYKNHSVLKPVLINTDKEYTCINNAVGNFYTENNITSKQELLSATLYWKNDWYLPNYGKISREDMTNLIQNETC